MSKTFVTVMSRLALLSMVLSACATPTPTAAPEATTAPVATTAPEATAAPAATAEPTQAPQAAGPVPIRVFMPQNTDTDIENNLFTKEMESKFNIDFTFETTTYDAASAKEKRQIGLASGDYPDLYMLIPWVDQFSQIDLLRYGQQGVVLPLNDLIDQYAPNVKAALESNANFRAQAVAPDGNIYGIPQIVECYHCSYPYKMWVNSKWLKALGLEQPKTTEEFRAMLEAFKTQDPNGNGKADEVPLSGSTEEFGVRPIPYLMNAFIYDDANTFLLLKDGKVDFAANKDEWKQGLTYIKSLYDEGLIDPGAFTQNADALKAIGSNADAELLGVGAGMHPAIFVEIGKDQYGADYDPLGPIEGPNGVKQATYAYPSVAGATFVLTNKATPEAQIAAMKVLDYLFTYDGELRGMIGEEGKEWRRPEAGEKALNDSVEPLALYLPGDDNAAPRNAAWGAVAQYFNTKDYRDRIVASEDLYDGSGFERRLQQATDLMAPFGPTEPYPYWAVWIDPAEADQAATLRQNIFDYVSQSSVEFITGVRSLDTDWDAYLAGLEGLDLKGYLDMMQRAYDSSK